MIRLLLLLFVVTLLPGQRILRARAALLLVRAAARLDVQVVSYICQSVSLAAELRAVESLLKDVEKEQPKWQGKSTLN